MTFFGAVVHSRTAAFFIPFFRVHQTFGIHCRSPPQSDFGQSKTEIQIGGKIMYYDPIECGARIAHLRTEWGLTQIQAAEKLNVSVQHFRAVEAGRRSASLELMVDISHIFHTSLDYLIVGKSRKRGLFVLSRN